MLVLQWSATKVHSKEEVNQGETLAMILYGLGLITIIKALKHFVMDNERHQWKGTLHVWYANDSALASSFDQIKDYFLEICNIAPQLGYHTEM